MRHDRIKTTQALLAETMFATPLSEDELSWMTAELLKTPTEVAVTMLSAVAYTDLRPLLPSLQLPVLVVNGGRSAVPPEVGPWLAGVAYDAVGTYHVAMLAGAVFSAGAAACVAILLNGGDAKAFHRG